MRTSRIPLAGGAALWAAAHLLLFVAFAAIFYRVFPQFLMQSHDAQNVYFTISKGIEWRSSLLEVYAYSPFSGLGSTFWPLFIPAIPYLTAFSISADPTVRLYLFQIGAASTLFAASLFFFRAARLERRTALAASWATFALVMLYALAYVSAPENLMVMVWSLVTLGLLLSVGGGPLPGNITSAVFFQVAFACFAVAVPAWHIIALPVFASGAFMLCLFAESPSQRAWRIGSLAFAIALQLAIGTYQALRFTLSDTARVMLPEQFAVIPHYVTISGHLLNNQPIDMLVAILFLTGIGWSRPRDFSPARGRAIYAATLLTYAVLVFVGLIFFYTAGPWPLPWPKYPLMFAYPLTALFAVLGAKVLLYERYDKDRARTAAIVLAFYLAWHVLNDPATTARSTGFAALACAIAAAGARLMTKPAGVVVLSTALLIGSLKFVNDSFGGGADRRLDGTARMGIGRTPLTDFLAAQVALEPGKPFRGRVDDLYSRPAESKDLIDTIISHWAGNWMKYGNGHKLFNWTAMDIPIAGDYNQYTKPPYFLLYTRLLNEPDDRQVFNYLSATRVNAGIWRMLGVRFVVTDRSNLYLPGSREVFSWDKFKVLELFEPNLGNYSPVKVIPAGSAEDALQILSQAGFDARTHAIADAAISDIGDLSAARTGAILLERGGFRVRGSSSGRSLLVLPVQFSHCLQLAPGSAARLLRVDLALTGILFAGELDEAVRYERWPLASTGCQERDLEDSRALLGSTPGTR